MYQHDHTDAELMRMVAAGDSSALGALYDRHVRLLTVVGRRFDLPQSTVDDLIHELFLRVWRRPERFDEDRGTALSWLTLQMRSRCLDLLRRDSRRAELLEEGADLLKPSRPADPPTMKLRKEVRQLVEQLDPDLREVILRAYFEGESTAEIAEMLGIPRGTVKSRMRRARESLRTSLESGGP